jgi:arabinogalactan oligomer / maltooligosaccharide transport system permease protein
MNDKLKGQPFYIWIPLGIIDLLWSIVKSLYEFVVSLFLSLAQFFVSIFKVIYGLSVGLYQGVVTYSTIFRKGDYKTRLSFLIMGSGAFLNKQLAKGILYAAFQLIFILLMVLFFGPYLAKFNTLGDTLGTPVRFDPTSPLADVFGYVPAQEADNSMIILLLSVAGIILSIIFIYFYFQNLRLAYENQLTITAGKQVPTFKQETNRLMNDKFHITVLSWPIFFAFIFTVLPLVFMILIAFTEFDRFHQPPGSLFTWVGFDNFVNMFSGENAFYSRLPGTLWAILEWSFIWAIFATFLNYFFGMILALMINKKGIRLKVVWRTVFVLTIAVPQFISLLIIRNFFNDQGPFVKFLFDLGLVGPGYSPFAQVDSARFWVIIVNLWVGVPYSMLITSGILMNIPQDLYESATIDGAGTIAKFFKITLPYMLFVTGPYLLTAFIGNINNFNIIYFLTGGGPSSQTMFQAGQTDLLVTWLFKLTLFDSDYKMASTLGILIFMISSFLSLIIFAKTGGVKNEDTFQ